MPAVCDDGHCTDTIQIEAMFAELCEDVAAEFLCTPSTGGMKPFKVNGTSAVELKRICITRIAAH